MVEFCTSEEVKEAQQQNRPIVALESTIITHGMPYPQNVQTAKEVEGVIRAAGAVPATIAIMKGTLCLGLSEEQLEELAQATDVLKCSKREIPYAMSKCLYGSTTVAATMFLAEKAGIKVFVTGGIGGVHRGAESTWDVSCDLTELAKTPVTVVCAGAKSILDIPKTLEFLETQGVPVLTWGTNTFPAFYVSKSECQVAMRVENAQDVAQYVNAANILALRTGVLVAVPIPEDEEAKDINDAINTAVEEAEAQNIIGAALTPFLLGRITELTEGRSLDSNICLIKHNAAKGAEIAIALKKAIKLD